MAKPTIVIVPGAMHCEAHYTPLMEDLSTHGLKSVVVSIPSTQSTDTPPAGLDDDTAAVKSAVLHELDDSKNDVLVLAHSYGGVPANNALSGLEAASRSAAGHSTVVKGIAFMCALTLPAGQTVAGHVASRGGDPVPAKNAVEMDSTGTFGLPKPSPDAEEALFNDLPVEEGKKWASLLRPISIAVMMGETKYAAFKDIPMGYLYCTKDEQLPLPAQEYVVAEAKKAGAKVVLEERVESSHSPFLSQVEHTSAFVRKMVELVS